MRVQVIATGSTHTGVVPGFGVPDTVASPPTTYAGWRPRAVLGADSPGGLLLPPAMPTSAHVYAPRAVWTDGHLVVAADTGNHRVLIWDHVPDTDGAAAAVVLGQLDEHSEGPAAGGVGPANGMHLPSGVLVHEGRLVVADAWHHRILVWDTVPTVTGTPPDHVLGQPDAVSVEPNAGGEPTATSLYWPFGIAVIDGRFHVADTGNRRVLVWRDGLPEPGQPADVVLGQPDPCSREENRGAGVGADSFRWPHAFADTGSGGVIVADAGNHRLLRWDRHPETDCAADAVLGHDDFTGHTEFPYVSQAGRLRFPYGVSSADGQLAIADTANNRVLLYASTDAVHDQAPYAALGQPTLAANGENRWEAVGADTLCWPYGLHWWRGDGLELILIADSGNNRVVIWERT
ncbi:MAG: NHL repeat-containing protein [Nocardioides sp.]|uniref:NHL repeat-containing protein n=1 Tax=Nocardioides sp. TaxID=35761 RepID=UPI003D1074E4